jgi:predicted outer membrane protein
MLPAVCLIVATANAQNSPTSPTVSPPTTNPPTTAPTTPPPATPPAVTVQKPILPDEPPTLAADREIAQMLIIDNNGEVAMAKLAESKVENPSVRAFAQRMVKDHLQMAQSLRLMASTMNPPAATVIATTPAPAGPTLDLEPRATQPIQPGPTTQGPPPAGRSTVAGTPSTPAAPGTAGTPTRAPLGSVPTPGSVPNSATVGTPGGLPVPGSTATPAPETPAVAVPSVAVAPRASVQAVAVNPNRGLDFVQIRRQIGDQCLTSATKDFDSMKPAEIEIAYMGQQIVAHEQMIATAKVLRLYASARLQSLIDRGIETAESHLTEAKEVMGNLTQYHPETEASTK